MTEIGLNKTKAISPKWALIHSVLQKGPSGLHFILNRGITSDHFGKNEDPTKNPKYWKLSLPGQVMEFLYDYISADRLPTPDEIKLKTGIDIPPYDNPLDLNLCTDVFIEGVLRNQLLGELDKNNTKLIKNPHEFRESLYDLYHSTSWVKGLDVDRTSNPDSIQEILDGYKKAKDNRSSGVVGLPSPWPSWDKRSRGLQKGHLTVIAAKRATGKSQLCFVWLNHIWQHALKAGERILFISMEMDSLMVKRRLFAISCGLDYTKFTEGRLTTIEERRFNEFCERLKSPERFNLPEIVFLYSNSIDSVRDIEVKAAEYKPALIFVDGLYIIGRGSSKSRWERTVDTIEELKLRLSLNYPVIATHQLKGTTNQNAMSADADELAYAKAIADYVDVLLGVFADDGHRRGNQRTIRTLKGRDFIPIDWRINFNLETQDYTEIDVIEADEPPGPTVEPPKNPRSEIEVGGPVFRDDDSISI